MKTLKRIGLALLAMFLVLIVVGFFLPRKVHLERSIDVNAPPEVVFDWVNHLKRTEKWSPWVAMEPTAALTYSGPEEGVGAKSAWSGKKIGEGSQEIVASERPKSVKVSLDFRKNGLADAYYTLEPAGSGTKVTWGFDTDMGVNPIARYFGLMMGSMMGPEFEKGLANLKSVSEQSAKDAADKPPAEESEAAPKE